MTLLKDNNYRNINTALLSLENDIKTRTAEFDTSVIDKQLADINKRIDEINVGDNSNNTNNSAEINDIRVSIDDINRGIDDINRDIDDIEQQLANIFSTKNFVEDFDTVTEPGIYYWNVNSSNRPAEYGVLLVSEYNGGSDSRWINQTAYGINGQIYFRQKINDGAWTSWKAIAFEGVTKTYTIPDVTTSTVRYIKLGTFPWNFTETVRVELSGNNFRDTVEFNVLGGNAKTASVNGWYTTNDGKTTGIYVVPVAPITYSSNIEVWLRVEQLTTLTVKLTGSTKAAQYFNTNPQMDYTTTVPSGAKTAATFNMERGFFGYNENTLNYYETTMKDLGFTKDQVVSLIDFAQTLINYTRTRTGQVHFRWVVDKRAYIKATAPYNTQLEISGGTLTFDSRTKNVSAAWNTFDAQYIDRTGRAFTLGIYNDDSTTYEYVRKLFDSSPTSLVIEGTRDVTLSTFGLEPLSIGIATGENMGIDVNEIQARLNGAVSPLYLNDNGGIVHINATGSSDGGLKVKGHLNIPVGAPTNPAKGDIWLVL